MFLSCEQVGSCSNAAVLAEIDIISSFDGSPSGLRCHVKPSVVPTAVVVLSKILPQLRIESPAQDFDQRLQAAAAVHRFFMTH